MKTINIVNGPQQASAVILGCMRMPALSVKDAAEMIRTAAEEGVNFFDHATCYGDGEAETRFGDAFPLSGLKREDIYIQSKCGLHPERGEFDGSKEDIVASAEASLPDISRSGMLSPASHFTMVWRATPTASARASWVRPFCFRSF